MKLGLAFVGGMAAQANKMIEEEREQQKLLITESLKLAAKERKQRDEEIKKRREQDLAAVDLLNTQYPDLSKEEKVALATDPTALDDILKNRDNPLFDPKKYIKLKAGFAIPEGKTERQFVEERYAVPQQESVAVPEAFKTGILSRSDDTYARTVSAALGYRLEDLTGPAPSLPAELNIATFDRKQLMKPRDFAERVKEQESYIADAVQQYGEDSEQANTAINQLNSLVKLKETLSPEQLKAADVLDRAKLAVLTAETPEEVATAQARYNDLLNRVGDNKEKSATLPQKISLFNKTVSEAIEAKMPTLKLTKGEVNMQPGPDGLISYQYMGTSEVAQANLKKVKFEAIKSMYRHFSDPQGRPISDDVALILTSYQVPIGEDGVPDFSVQVPTQEKPGTGKATPAQATPAQSRAPVTMSDVPEPTVKLPSQQQSRSPFKPGMGPSTQAAQKQKTPDVLWKEELERLRNDITALDREVAYVKKNSDPKTAKMQLEILLPERPKLVERLNKHLVNPPKPAQPAVAGRWNPKTQSWE